MMGPFADGWTTDDVARVIRRDDPAEVLYVPIVVGMSAPDCGVPWATAQCVQLAAHRDAKVRANAMIGLGHIARTSRALDLEVALPVLRAGAVDVDPDVQANARDAISDLRVFMSAAMESHPLAAGL